MNKPDFFLNQQRISKHVLGLWDSLMCLRTLADQRITIVKSIESGVPRRKVEASCLERAVLRLLGSSAEVDTRSNSRISWILLLNGTPKSQ